MTDSIAVNMRNSPALITGMGAVTAIGQDITAISQSLKKGTSVFSFMTREGRCSDDLFIGAELPALTMPTQFDAYNLSTCSLSAKAALVALQQAWTDARLDTVEPEKIGLIVGGSNVQQRHLNNLRDKRKNAPYFIQPSYALNFMDSDICGICTELFGIRGSAFSLGGASASGQLAVIEAAKAVTSGALDVCVVVGALMDLSYWECHAFSSLGAMGSSRFSDAPTQACRPFDQQRDGFIYGEGCGVLVLERHQHALQRGAHLRGAIPGCAVVMDGNRNPDPSLAGEIAVIQQVLHNSAMTASDIDYINPHGSGSVLGDDTELQALAKTGLRSAPLNATKSLFGHALSAAGCLEIIATLIQMEQGFLHPSLNLDNPIQADFNWVTTTRHETNIKQALSLSYGFGGLNTAVCIIKP
ncbi:beta-ketoacyl synthase N-terminal-like domain-containing protein [Alkalimonas collagenimarina]|uniref:Beta-ketoacyl synthase N-terminal-like domain-containing protein n=1 Tax=Alkalimonas collagenimarina TaxID=400390 RepID=A0ABT9H0X9_9GAMM|nr:beta-ketoacyl synthase N-terminal-like domain-containing protein [Alkalimonas collagenimarina]MDP4536958.1 beta-ketoacyl synthase N-terminal-like domain-containing protein [Alkalimonas collagenimarina]